MARYYKSINKKYEENDDLANLILGVVIFFIICLVVAYNVGLGAFLITLASETSFILLVIFMIKFIKRNKEKAKKAKIEKLVELVQKAGLEGYIGNFISRFGLGQEKDKNAWTRRNYKISWYRIHDLTDILNEHGADLSSSDTCIILSHYIDKKELDLTANSIAAPTNNFSKLKGTDFEYLLYRLYESMGYLVQVTGKTGDQGGDLIATKGQERVLIQAKCYKDWSVGNNAVQQAVAAKNHYDCNRAMVITTSVFTREATELAKTNNVELVPRGLLQAMLLDNLKESWN